MNTVDQTSEHGCELIVVSCLCRFELDFFAVSDDGIFSQDVLEGRLEKEATSLAAWVKNKSRFQHLADFHKWLHETHLCYSVTRQSEYGLQEGMSEVVRKSY